MEFGRKIVQRKVLCNGAFDGAPIKEASYLIHTEVGVCIQQMSEPEGIEAASNHHIIVLVFMHLAVVFAFNVYACAMSIDAPQLAST